MNLIGLDEAQRQMPRILDDPSARMIVVQGPSGSGKSTLVQHIFCEHGRENVEWTCSIRKDAEVYLLDTHGFQEPDIYVDITSSEDIDLLQKRMKSSYVVIEGRSDLAERLRDIDNIDIDYIVETTPPTLDAILEIADRHVEAMEHSWTADARNAAKELLQNADQGAWSAALLVEDAYRSHARHVMNTNRDISSLSTEEFATITEDDVRRTHA